MRSVRGWVSGGGATVLAIAGGVIASGCRPDSVTGAREQLAGDDTRAVTYRLPLTREAYGPRRFLENTTTEVLEDGVLAIPLPSDTLRGPVGAALLFTRRLDFEIAERVPPGALRRDEMASAIAVSEIRRAPLRLVLYHTSRATLVLVEPSLALVRTDASGEPVRDDSGALDLERGSSGAPIRVPLGDRLEIARGQRLELEREAAPVVDRLAELLVAREPVAIVLTASLRVSGSDQPRVRPGDALFLIHRVSVALDLVPPDSGIVIRRTEVLDGLGFSDLDADDIEERLIGAGTIVDVENEIPFRLRVHLAYVGGRRANEDVFEAEDRVLLEPLTVAGRRGPGGPIPRETLEVEVPGSRVRPLLGDDFTLGIRIRLLPGPAPGGRGALRIMDLVRIDAQVFADLRARGGS